MTLAVPIFLIALNHNLSYPLQAHAQINNIDNTISSNVTSDMANKVISEQPIVLRGIVSSEDFNNVTLKAGKIHMVHRYFLIGMTEQYILV